MASQQQQQQPSPPRPWFRIASMARPTAPTPTPLAQPSPPSQPRLPFIRPTFNQTLATPTQPPPPPTATTSSFSAPPPPKLVSPSPPPPPPPVAAGPSATATTTTTVHVATPMPSPKTTKPQPNNQSPSPKIKPQLKSDNIPLEEDQKTVLVQEKTIQKPMVIPRASNPDLQWQINDTKTKDYGVFGMRVMTIAGENRGAIMELSHSSSHKPQILYKKASDGEKSGMDSSSGEEGRKKNKDKSSEKAMAMPSSSSSPRNVFLNSNVQGVNNSLLYNCSCTHNDPGIHLSLSRNTNGSAKDRMHSQK